MPFVEFSDLFSACLAATLLLVRSYLARTSHARALSPPKLRGPPPPTAARTWTSYERRGQPRIVALRKRRGSRVPSTRLTKPAVSWLHRAPAFRDSVSNRP
ncbi:hypothetical protein MRX96_012940 [Rhipicephalus microplus]